MALQNLSNFLSGVLFSGKIYIDKVVKIIQKNNSKKLRKFIDNKRLSDINIILSGHNNYSLLMIACLHGSFDCAVVLLENSAININTRGDDCLSAIELACKNGCIELINILFEKNVYIDDTIIFRCLHARITTRIVRLLVTHINDIDYKNEYGITFLHQACTDQHEHIACILLEAGATVIPIYTSHWFSTRVIELLLKYGADPNYHYPNGISVLYKLASPEYRSSKPLERVQLLLASGADVNFAHPVMGTTVLMNAMSGYSHPSNIFVKFGLFSMQELITACEEQQVYYTKLISMLLEHGADVTAVDNNGRSVLDMRHEKGGNNVIIDMCIPYIESNQQDTKAILK